MGMSEGIVQGMIEGQKLNFPSIARHIKCYYAADLRGREIISSEIAGNSLSSNQIINISQSDYGDVRERGNVIMI